NARNVPPIAMMPQMYPWRLKDAMPPKYAPMLQPNARRAPYPISSPPMTDAKKLPFVTLVNLNSPPAADAMNAPRITPKLSTVVESANMEDCRATADSPCQYPQLATSIPKNCRVFDPRSANAEVMPYGCPRVMSVSAFSTARAVAAASSGHEPLNLRFQPSAEGSGATLGELRFFSMKIVPAAIAPKISSETIHAPP